MRGLYTNMVEYCSKCGAEIPEGSKFCPKCGQPVEYPERVYEPEVVGPARSTSRRAPGPGTTESASGAVTIGIIGLVLACCIPLIGCILGIIAIVMGSSASHRGASNASTAMTIGAIAIVLAIVVEVISLLIVLPYLGGL